ncbi:hypothetical protein BC829DRAFT_403287, partial [Chytridium lagenaria]
MSSMQEDTSTSSMEPQHQPAVVITTDSTITSISPSPTRQPPLSTTPIFKPLSFTSTVNPAASPVTLLQEREPTSPRKDDTHVAMAAEETTPRPSESQSTPSATHASSPSFVAYHPAPYNATPPAPAPPHHRWVLVPDDSVMDVVKKNESPAPPLHGGGEKRGGEEADVAMLLAAMRYGSTADDEEDGKSSTSSRTESVSHCNNDAPAEVRFQVFLMLARL